MHSIWTSILFRVAISINFIATYHQATDLLINIHNGHSCTAPYHGKLIIYHICEKSNASQLYDKHENLNMKYLHISKGTPKLKNSFTRYWFIKLQNFPPSNLSFTLHMIQIHTFITTNNNFYLIIKKQLHKTISVPVNLDCVQVHTSKTVLFIMTYIAIIHTHTTIVIIRMTMQWVT